MKLKTKLRAAKSILSANLAKKSIPLTVYLSLTDRCPTKCVYCNIPNRRQSELETHQIFEIISAMREAGTQRLQLVGGEPLVRKDIGRIIDFAKQKDLVVTLSTGGFYIPPKVKEIKNVDIVFLSFDGEENSHDFHRGEGSYKKFLEAVDSLLAHEIKFWTTTVLTSRNRNHIDFILRFAEDKKFLTNYHLLYYTGNSFKDHFHPSRQPNSLVMADEEIREVIRTLIRKKGEGAAIASSMDYLKYILNWDDYSKAYSQRVDKKVKCWAGKLYCYIDTAGLMYPCGDSIGRVEGYDVTEIGFKKAFDSLNEIPCSSCVIACGVEQNLMFSLRLSAIWNWLKNIG